MSNSGTLRIQNSRDARAELRVENNERFLNYFRFLVKTGARDDQNRLSRTFCCFVKGASKFFIGILIDGVAGRAVTATIAIEVFAVWVVFVLGSVELMCNVNGIGSTAQRISIKNGNCDQLTREAFCCATQSRLATIAQCPAGEIDSRWRFSQASLLAFFAEIKARFSGK